MNKDNLALSINPDAVYRKLHYKYTSNFSKEDLISEIQYTAVLCSQKFDSRKGRFYPFFYKSLLNNLNGKLYSVITRKQNEVPIDGINYPYTPKEDEDLALMAFIGGLPTPFVNLLTEFVLGKIKKQDQIGRAHV